MDSMPSEIKEDLISIQKSIKDIENKYDLTNEKLILSLGIQTLNFLMDDLITICNRD